MTVNSPEPIRVIVRLQADRDKIADAERLLTQITEPSRANPDCLEFRVFRDANDPALFTLCEHWRSFEANRSHAAQDYMAEFVQNRDTVFVSKDPTIVEELTPPAG